MKILVPPIKSQGIKTKLVPWIRALIPRNSGRWIEPFLGTGVVGFNSQARRAIMGDTNPHIVAFYKGLQDGSITPQSVRAYLTREGEMLEVADNDGYAHYRVVRDRFNKEHAPLDFLFLSRAGFNGMMRFSKRGGWNIPFCKKSNRFSASYITKIVNQVDATAAIIRPTWKFVCQDFRETIAVAGADDLVYCDPPYIGRYVDYYNGWSEGDEQALAELLSNTPARFILSTWHHNDYRENVMLSKYWSRFNIVTRDHFYHSGAKLENRKSIVEALVFNFEAQVSAHNHDTVETIEQLTLDL